MSHVVHRRSAEHQQVSREARPYRATIPDAEFMSGHRGLLSDRLTLGEHPYLRGEVAKHATVGARVRCYSPDITMDDAHTDDGTAVWRLD
jgi:hypothetical protein